MLRDLIGAAALLATPKVQVVASVGSVKAGVSACLEHKPSLVIMGWLLPDGPGSLLVERVRQVLPQLRYLVVTSSEDSKDVHEAGAARVDGFVFLRDSVETLHEAIATILQGQRYFCAESLEMLETLVVSGEHRADGSLTRLERIILRGVADGLATKELAERLALSTTTINKLLKTLKEKLNIHETASLVRHAVKLGLVDS